MLKEADRFIHPAATSCFAVVDTHLHGADRQLGGLRNLAVCIGRLAATGDWEMSIDSAVCFEVVKNMR